MTTDTPARAGLGARLVFAIPLLGGMLREVAQDPERAVLPFLINVILALVLATCLFGPIVPVGAAMVLAPLALGMIVLMSADFGRSI